MGIRLLACSRTAHSHFDSSITMLKVFFVALFVALALGDECYEPKPKYCAANGHLCKAAGFVDFMKKMCPRHCGYCDGDVLKIDCNEPRPEYCAANVHLCKAAGFVDFMKKMCPRHCGYCDGDVLKIDCN